MAPVNPSCRRNRTLGHKAISIAPTPTRLPHEHSTPLVSLPSRGRSLGTKMTPINVTPVRIRNDSGAKSIKKARSAAAFTEIKRYVPGKREMKMIQADLEAKCFKLGFLSPLRFPLTSSSFKEVFEFLIKFLHLDFTTLSQPFDRDVVQLLKWAGYPGQASRQTFQTVGTSFSMATVLNALHFLSVKAELIAHVERRDIFFDGNCEDKIMLDCFFATYSKFYIDGVFDYECEYLEFEKDLMACKEADVSGPDLNEIEEKIQETLDEYVVLDGKVKKLKDIGETMDYDLDQIRSHCVKRKGYLDRQLNNLDTIKSRLTEKSNRIIDLRKRVEENARLLEVDLKEVNQTIGPLKSYISKFEKSTECLDAEIYNRQEKTGSLSKKLDVTCKDFNLMMDKIANALKCESVPSLNQKTESSWVKNFLKKHVQDFKISLSYLETALQAEDERLHQVKSSLNKVLKERSEAENQVRSTKLKMEDLELKFIEEFSQREAILEKLRKELEELKCCESPDFGKLGKLLEEEKKRFEELKKNLEIVSVNGATFLKMSVDCLSERKTVQLKIIERSLRDFYLLNQRKAEKIVLEINSMKKLSTSLKF